MQHDKLSATLIAEIYEAAVDDEKWPNICKLIGAAAGIEHMGVWIVDNGRIVDISLADIWQPLGATYRERFSALDPWAKSLARAPAETVMLGCEHLAENDLIKTEFYNEFARSGGMFRPMGVRLELGAKVFANLGSDLPWSKLRFEHSDKPRLQRIIPYVKPALQLRHRWRKTQARIVGKRGALDALAFGVVVCEATGDIVFANRAAEALAAAGAGIVMGRRGYGLRAALAAETRRLALLIKSVGSGGPGGVLRLTGRQRSPELVALVTPMPPTLDASNDTVHGHVLVTLRSASDCPSFSAQTLMHLYGLSPTQAEIALAIFSGKTARQIAAARGVAISTLRTHLAEIFLRTGVDDQRELVRLLGTIPPVCTQPTVLHS